MVSGAKMKWDGGGGGGCREKWKSGREEGGGRCK